MPVRLVCLLLSAILHVALLGAAYTFMKSPASSQEPVYQVALVDALGPVSPASDEASAGSAASPVLEPEPPTPEPVKPEPARPEPPRTEAPRPEPSKPEPPKPAIKPRPVTPSPKPEQPAPSQETPSPAQPSLSPSATPPAIASGSAATPGEGSAGVPRQGPFLQAGGLLAYDANAVDVAPIVSRRVTPEYPPRARRLRIEGQAVVRLIVDAAGLPQDCRIESADPTGYFEEAALDAARKTRFFPGQVDGRAVNTVVLVPFVFTLR